jgi:hypothetical protein
MVDLTVVDQVSRLAPRANSGTFPKQAMAGRTGLCQSIHLTFLNPNSVLPKDKSSNKSKHTKPTVHGCEKEFALMVFHFYTPIQIQKWVRDSGDRKKDGYWKTRGAASREEKFASAVALVLTVAV